MGHHLNENGFFQSDKHPELKEHKIMLDFRDEYAQKALKKYALLTHDTELSEDIQHAIINVNRAGLTKKPD